MNANFLIGMVAGALMMFVIHNTSPSALTSGC